MILRRQDDGRCLPALIPVSTPSVSFVIPVRNSGDTLPGCLQSIRENVGGAEAEIIIVDNGSVDDSVKSAQDAGGRIIVCVEATVAELRNRGVAAALSETIAFVDADHILDRQWIAQAMQLFQDEAVAAAGAPCHPPESATWVQRVYDGLRDHRPGVRDVEWLGSGNLAIRRSVFLALGGFDTTLETCEDVDLCQRLRAGGHRIIADERLRSIHLGDPPTLKALFVGELWRGRDNLRVTLRSPGSIRGLLSLLIPVLQLCCLAIVVAGLALTAYGGWRFSIAAVAIFAACSAARGARLVYRLDSRSPLAFLRAAVVEVVYDLARALALVVHVGHRRRTRKR